MAAPAPFESGSIYIIIYIPPFWSGSFLESIADQLLESSTNQLLKSSLVFNCQVARFGSVIPVPHLRRLIPGMSRPMQKVKCLFRRSLRPHFINKHTRSEEGFYHPISLRTDICSFLRFLIWHLIGCSDHLKTLSNHYQNGVFITLSYAKQRCITAKVFINKMVSSS